MDAKPTADESLPDQPLPIVPDAWFRRVVEDSTDFAFMTFDLRGCFTSWNAGAHQALGYEAAEVLGRSGALIYASENGQSGKRFLPPNCKRRCRMGTPKRVAGFCGAIAAAFTPPTT